MRHRLPPALPPASTLLVSVLAVLASTPAVGLRYSQEGNRPLSPRNYAEWPGLAEVANDKSRVFHVGGNGTEQNYYRGNATALERTLRAFAASEVKERVVILRPGRGEFSKPRGGAESYDWKLGLVGGRARSFFDEQDAELVWAKCPILTVYTGGGVDLKSLKIPKGITQLVQVHDLRERYMSGIRSTSERVRRYAIRLLAEVDPYGVKSAAAVAELLRDEEVRSAAERALAEFKKREDDSAEVRAAYAAEVRRIRQFVFTWRYPWLESALRLAVVAAVVLLFVTLVVARARRSRQLREPRSEASGLPGSSCQ